MRTKIISTPETDLKRKNLLFNAVNLRAFIEEKAVLQAIDFLIDRKYSDDEAKELLIGLRKNIGHFRIPEATGSNNLASVYFSLSQIIPAMDQFLSSNDEKTQLLLNTSKLFGRQSPLAIHILNILLKSGFRANECPDFLDQLIRNITPPSAMSRKNKTANSDLFLKNLGPAIEVLFYAKHSKSKIEKGLLKLTSDLKERSVKFIEIWVRKNSLPELQPHSKGK